MTDLGHRRCSVDGRLACGPSAAARLAAAGRGVSSPADAPGLADRAAGALPRRPPHRQRRHGLRLGGRGPAARPGRRGQGARSPIRRRSRRPRALPARGADGRAGLRPVRTSSRSTTSASTPTTRSSSWSTSPAARSPTAARGRQGRRADPAQTALRWLREAAAGARRRPRRRASSTATSSRRTSCSTRRVASPSRDFGIARLVDDTDMTQTGQVLGTAAYISPEQALGQPATDASDRYALAVVAYELLTGSRPFAAARRPRRRSRTPRPSRRGRPDRRRSCRAALDACSLRGLAKEPAERPATATELVAAIESALERRGGGRPTRPFEPVEPTRPTRRMEPRGGRGRRRPRRRRGRRGRGAGALGARAAVPGPTPPDRGAAGRGAAGVAAAAEPGRPAPEPERLRSRSRRRRLTRRARARSRRSPRRPPRPPRAPRASGPASARAPAPAPSPRPDDRRRGPVGALVGALLAGVALIAVVLVLASGDDPNTSADRDGSTQPAKERSRTSTTAAQSPPPAPPPAGGDAGLHDKRDPAQRSRLRAQRAGPLRGGRRAAAASRSRPTRKRARTSCPTPTRCSTSPSR